MNKIRLMTCVQGRKEITLAFLWHLAYLRKETGLELPITIAVSDEDDYDLIMEDKTLLTEKCNVIKTPNNPVSEKHNQMLRAAYREPDWDAVIHVGSDDLMTVEYVKHVAEMKLDQNTVYGIKTMLFYNVVQDKLRKFTYKGVRQLGAGRVFPRKVIDKTRGKKLLFRRPWYGWLIGETQNIPDPLVTILLERSSATVETKSKRLPTLWAGKKDSGLDNDSMKVLDAIEVDYVNLDEVFDEPQIVDLKTREGITPWERIGGYNYPQNDVDKHMNRISPDVTFKNET